MQNETELIDRMREHIVEGVDDIEHSGLASARQRLSSAADSLGNRVSEATGGQGIDIVEMTRRYPIPALVAAIGLGYLIARSVG